MEEKSEPIDVKYLEVVLIESHILRDEVRIVVLRLEAVQRSVIHITLALIHIFILKLYEPDLWDLLRVELLYDGIVALLIKLIEDLFCREDG